jgi:hypothetical protein
MAARKELDEISRRRNPTPEARRDFSLQCRLRMSYKYRALPRGHIRILILHPGSGRQGLRCSLESASLDSDPSYEAISYCWGSSDKTHNILCHGHRMAITKSLYEALWQFRYPDRPRRLWADAVCINQGDISERNAQVEEMHNVYRKATRSLVWLGNESSTDHFVFEAIRKLQPALEDFPKVHEGGVAFLEWCFSKADLNERVNAIDSNLKTDAACSAFAAVNGRDIFRRAWIVQELAVAETPLLCCGTQCMDFDTFALCFDFITWALWNASVWLPWMSYGTFHLCTMRTRRLIFRSDETSVLELLTTASYHWGFRCMLAVDYAYAIRGLLREESRTTIPVDYSLDHIDLYQRIIANAVKLGEVAGLWDCLAYGNHGRAQGGHAIPSWVPDISQNGAHYFTRSFQAWTTTNVEAPLPEMENSAILVVAGALVTSLQVVDSQLESFKMKHSLCYCCETISPVTFTADHFKSLCYPEQAGMATYPIASCEEGRVCVQTSVLRALCHRVQLLRRICALMSWDPSGRAFFEDDHAWRAICLDVDQFQQRLGDAIPFDRSHWQRLCTACPYGDMEAMVPAARSLLASLSEADLEQLYECYSIWAPKLAVDPTNCYARTVSGELAWVPSVSQPGDQIAILALPVSRMPLVLRPDGKGCHKVIGEAFVYGIMDGEATPESIDDVVEIRLS